MFKLQRYFSLTSLVAFVVVTLFLGWFYRQILLSDLLQIAESKNVTLTQAFSNSLWPDFGPFVASASSIDQEALQSSPEVSQLHQKVLDQMAGLSVIKVKVYSLDGLTVFSTEAAQIGQDKSDNAGFLAAKSGKVVSELTYRDTFSAFEGTIENRNVLSSYIPIRHQNATGQIEGVIELYDDVTPFLQKLERSQRMVVLGVALTLFILYLVLFLIVRQANKIIKQQYLETKAGALALEKANAQLSAAHEQLEERVKERTLELTQTNEDLENLLYIISHDLKEPLRAIQNFSQLVNRRYAKKLDTKGADFLRRIEQAAKRMQRLISDILELSRAQRAELKLEIVAGDEIIEEVLQQLERVSREKEASIQITPPLPQLYVNRTYATQALYNLLLNALKYTMPDKPPDVEISAYSGDEGIGIVIKDRGLGVPPEKAEEIFQLFKRGVEREIEGTGAGLAIVRQIAQRHGGQAWVQAREGGGSEFVITFGVK